jgi:4'-phosphopantetheinyl transferase EntD
VGFERVLRHGRVVAVEVGEPDEDALAELHPDERARAAGLAPLRRREWVAGRRALRRALMTPWDAAILADDRGAPRLPRGAVGSVSHKRALAVALAAPDDGWTVGVDLEPARREPGRVDIAPRVLTPAERAALDAVTGEARERAVLLAFALKEALYKAIDPHLRRYVGFQEVAVWPDPGAGAGEARVEPQGDWGLELEAAWVTVDDYLLCTARARLRTSSS